MKKISDVDFSTNDLSGRPFVYFRFCRGFFFLEMKKKWNNRMWASSLLFFAFSIAFRASWLKYLLLPLLASSIFVWGLSSPRSSCPQVILFWLLSMGSGKGFYLRPDALPDTNLLNLSGLGPAGTSSHPVAGWGGFINIYMIFNPGRI